MEAFGSSPEYLEKFDGLGSEQQVSRLYQNLFDREPEADGLAYWAGKLDRGELPLSHIAVAVAEGAQGSDRAALDNTVIRFNAPSLTLAEALDLEDLPAHFTLDPAALADGGTVAVAEAETILAEVSALVEQAANADELAVDALFEWRVLDSAEAVLAAVEPGIPAHVAGAREVRVTDSEVSQQQLEALEELDNFVPGDLAPAPDPAFFDVVAVGEAEVDADATASVSVEVANSGDEAGTQDVVLTISDGSVTQTLTEADVTLAGGAITSVTFTVDPDALGLAPGDYDLTAATEDASETRADALSVAAATPSPELSIDSVMFAPEQPPVDEDFAFQISMTESADVAPENLQLTFAIPGVTSQTFNLSPFQGESVSFTPGADAIDQPGDHDALFTLDADNAEPVEFEKELVILADDEASIVVDALDVSDSSQLEPDDIFNVNVSLAEIAGNDVSNLSVQLVIEDAGIDLALDADDLDANGSIEVESNDLSIDQAGFYEAEIHISADNARDVSATTGFTVTTTPHDAVEIADGLELLWTEDTDLFPFSAIGQVQVQHEGSSGFSAGSGVMISPQHIMTNHHVLQGSSSLTEIEEINFFNGLSGSVQESLANDAFTSGGTELDNGLWSLEGDIEAFSSAADDIAIVRLDEAIDNLTNGHFDWFWNESGGSRDLTGEDVMWAGYPVQDMEQDDPSTNDTYFHQWQAFGTIDEYADDDGQLMLSDSLMGRSGASGSPLFRETSDGAELLGLYTGRIDAGGGDQTPVASTITPEVHDWALAIVQSDGFFTDIDTAMG
ncbi:trypsin-like peptidase domain-containing protein [uncultured Halomonas sp.]|uniref:trypsin-like peptidase domain-containing protein n=1 Tax=uncultured Halomonas sp. TaxID=173971 RepID=UPI00260BBA0B|nr:trypsin-like peptidase domain-containing protein [uncultured Halomonas sp.]